MKTLLFTGQGSQKVGMGSDFFNKFELVKKIFSEANEILGFNLSKIILEGPSKDLILTQNTQPAIMTLSYSIFKVLENEFGLKINNFKFFAGHSLGEYSALVCSKSLNFNDALFLLRERGKAMQNAVPVGEGAMLAILGIKIDAVELEITELKSNELVEIANDNAPGQIIVSGTTLGINNLQKKLKDKKIKSILLPVSAPFHCSLMKTASEEMREKINSINFIEPQIEIISNINALPQKKPEIIKKLLIDQIYSTVKWRESIEYMEKNQIKTFIEIGPGKVLSGLAKRISGNINVKSINTIEDIKSLK